jgi:hypothetical protein
MIWTDPIVEEVRREREAYGAQFNYDIKAICGDLREREKLRGGTLVMRPIGVLNPAIENTLTQIENSRQQRAPDNLNRPSEVSGR